MRLSDGAIDEGTWGRAPIADPLSYPGVRPLGSFLVSGDDLFPVLPQPGRRLGYARVIADEHHQVTFLDRFLHRHGEVAMGARYPVLAYGSNASPSQLHRKLGADSVSRVVPVTMVSIRGIDLAYGATVGYYGAIPAVIRAGDDPDEELVSWVTWLDAEQMELVDRTEPGYHRIGFDPSAVQITVAGSGERIDDVMAYRWEGQVLALDGRVPRPTVVARALEGSSWLAPEAMAGESQAELWGRVLADLGDAIPTEVRPPSFETVEPQVLVQLAALPGVRAWFAERGVPDGLDAIATEVDPTTYDEDLGSGTLPVPAVAHTFTAIPTTDAGFTFVGSGDDPTPPT